MTRRRDILVIEDDASMRELISSSLTDAGFRVSATTEKSASHLTAMKADAIVVSINSPKSTRFDVIEMLRKQFPSSALVAISGYFPASTLTCGALAAELGVDRTVPKPLRMDQLIAMVTELTGATQDRP
ncbi:Response regulator receiver domain (plasmid) [Paraburkholderia caribensis MBA4]|uniref:Response regulator receiver domain n=1 Tax=Paraburkholderia caribensis MBA4 TaxID=1323664 RepID=A0A0P0RN27_9BURK|nr:response regulator [Paraburkholderia caribensis]ALL70314.1 Response regulator receiver domain [Paraburkholderia caribensis MBA4]